MVLSQAVAYIFVFTFAQFVCVPSPHSTIQYQVCLVLNETVLSVEFQLGTLHTVSNNGNNFVLTIKVSSNQSSQPAFVITVIVVLSEADDVNLIETISPFITLTIQVQVSVQFLIIVHVFV
jgi:hypothetical protein